MNSALISRVSTLEQATDGYSISVQKEKLELYAKAQGYSFEHYCDEGFSGKDLNRPALKRLLCDIKDGKIKIVLIYKLDRLSRRVKDILELVELFEKHSVILYSLSESLDLTSPFGRAALKMLATFSELERETIIERMMMGKTARAKSGRYSCPGKVPFGYRASQSKDDELEIYEIEAEAIRKIFDLYINYNFTFRKLYDYCKEVYPDIKYFGNQMCCKALIKRPMYAGYFKWGDELIKGVNFPAIIDYETFLLAQNKIEENRTKRSVDNTPYLLTGLIFCAKCGNRYVGKLYDRYSYKKNGGRTKSYKYRSYGCAARVKRDKKYHPALCDNIIIPAQKLEEKIDTIIKNIDFINGKTTIHTTGFLDSLVTERAALNSKKDKLLDLYLEKAIDKDIFTTRLLEIEAKLKEYTLLIECETESTRSSTNESLDIIQKALKNYDTLDKKEKAILLKCIVKNIIIDGENITIHKKLKY